MSIAVRVCLAMVAVLFSGSGGTPSRHSSRRGFGRRDRPASRPHPLRSTLSVTDQPVAARWFERIGEWAVILFLRCRPRADVRGANSSL